MKYIYISCQKYYPKKLKANIAENISSTYDKLKCNIFNKIRTRNSSKMYGGQEMNDKQFILTRNS